MASQNSEFTSDTAKKHDFSAGAQRMRPALGTFCSIQAAGESVDLEHAINHAFEAIHRVNDLMHPVRGTDLSRINRCAAAIIHIDEWTWQVLQLAKQVNEMSGGVFDPCLPSQAGCMRDVELLSDNQVICHARVMIDLGGIAKGFAVDRAVEALIEAGCSSGLVNAGGDVRVFGEMQQIHINYGDQSISIELCDQALAVSRVNHADRPVEHQGYYHRNPERLLLHEHVAVMAQSAAVADALTKCVMFLPQARCECLFSEFYAQLVFAGVDSKATAY